ncbi:MAG: MaoC family dehydratase [Clostridiales bacterium]|nr:MaoC family dehydratase [Clostridiales bacterium]MDD7035189.1 MaoC family dehydratase [Bacillota bacterium]MDY2920035.1 MaoC family dehydratase [Lentihominibacter sp.]
MKEDKFEKKTVHVGDRASLTKKFTEDDIRIFTELTLDDNGMHTDEELSAAGLFRRPVVHGVLVGSLISSVMGKYLPGNGTVLREENIRFINPVYPGEEITAAVELTGIREERRYYIGTLHGTCHNQDGVLVAEAECSQLMLKRFFTADCEKGNEND